MYLYFSVFQESVKARQFMILVLRSFWAPEFYSKNKLKILFYSKVFGLRSFWAPEFYSKNK